MKNFVAILLMLCLLLPGSGWARVVAVQPCDATGQIKCVLPAVPHCPCCQPGQCPCLDSKDQEIPAPPVPSLPPRPASGSDLMFMPPAWDVLTVRLVPSVPATCRVKGHDAVATAALSVPLYIRHCSPLW